MRKKGKWGLIIAIVLVVGISALLFIQSTKQPDSSQQRADSNPMLQFPVSKEDIANSIEVKGKSSYKEETSVYAPFDAEVKAWHVEEGARINKGDLLFELDGNQLSNQISKMQAGLKKMELDSKIRKLAAEGNEQTNEGLTAEKQALQQYTDKEENRILSELDEVNLSVAQAELDEKLEQLNQAVFLAPEAGIFLFNENKEPQVVTNQKPLGKIVDLSKLQLICTVGEFEVFKIKEGMAVEVKVDALKQTKLQGMVERVSKFAKSGTDQGTGSAQFEVIISLEQNEKLIAGLSLTGTIETEKKQGAVVVPTIAVQREQEQYYVYVQNETGIEKRVIEIGMETADKTEVLTGVKEGETLVLQ